MCTTYTYLLCVIYKSTCPESTSPQSNYTSPPIIKRECRQTLGLGLGQRTEIDINIIISLQRRKGT